MSLKIFRVQSEKHIESRVQSRENRQYPFFLAWSLTQCSFTIGINSYTIEKSYQYRQFCLSGISTCEREKHIGDKRFFFLKGSLTQCSLQKAYSYHTRITSRSVIRRHRWFAYVNTLVNDFHEHTGTVTFVVNINRN